MVVLLRLIPYLFVLVVLGLIMWQAGKRHGWWEALAANLQRRRRQRQRAWPIQQPGPDRERLPAPAAQPAESARRGNYPVVAEIWVTTSLHPEGVWLYTRSNRMIRFCVVDQVLYIERLTTEGYDKRWQTSKAGVELFTFRRDGNNPRLQYVTVRCEVTPDRNLLFAHTVSKGVAGVVPEISTLQRLLNDLRVATVPPDIDEIPGDDQPGKDG